MSISNLAEFKDNMKRRAKNTLGNHIRGQLIRCFTSLAANYGASCVAQTIPMIISKLSISIEDADESEFLVRIYR